MPMQLMGLIMLTHDIVFFLKTKRFVGFRIIWIDAVGIIVAKSRVSTIRIIGEDVVK